MYKQKEIVLLAAEKRERYHSVSNLLPTLWVILAQITYGVAGVILQTKFKKVPLLLHNLIFSYAKNILSMQDQ